MQIECPKCNTQFLVTSKQLGKHGRKVKCSQCAHVWHQQWQQETPLAMDDYVLTPSAATVPPLSSGVNLPAVVPIKIHYCLYILPIILIGLIIFLSTTLFANRMVSDASSPDNKVSIKDLHIQNNQEAQKIVVNYKVYNGSNKVIKMPLVRIRLFDKSGRVIKTLVDDHAKINMSPDQYIQIKSEFIPAPSTADSIDVMIGNKMDFLLR